jgi:transcriptional regulator with XRE-family HTH domain
LKARGVTGMTRVEAAKKLEISVSYLEKLELGYGESKPSRELLIRMCKVYGCKINELVKVK